jgi:hypothetical protein
MAALTRKKARKRKRKLSRQTGFRTAWHLLLFLLLQERAPRSFTVRAEVPLGRELPRADVLLLRREQAPTDEARVLRGLWPRIARDAVVEFKSVSRPIRRGELSKLLGYAGIYFWMETDRLKKRSDLLTVLLVPGMTPTLKEELEDLELVESVEATEGYREYRGGTYPLLVVELDRVAESERDELLGFLGNGTLNSIESERWLRRIAGYHMESLESLEEYDEMEAKFMAKLRQKLLASMSPEEVMKHYEPKQRLAGLTPEQKAELRRLLDEQN